MISGAGDQPHASTIPAREDAEALDFVNPARPRRGRLSR